MWGEMPSTWFLYQPLGFWAFYLGTLIMGWGLLALLVGPPLAGTYLHLLHSVVSLYGLHWMKGATDTDNVYGADGTAAPGAQSRGPGRPPAGQAAFHARGADPGDQQGPRVRVGRGAPRRSRGWRSGR